MNLQELKNELIRIIDQQLKEGKLDKVITKTIDENGRKKIEQISLSDPQQYFEYLLERKKIKKGNWYSDEYYYNAIKREDLKIVDIDIETNINQQIKLKDLKEGMDGIITKGVVILSELRVITKEQKVYKIARIVIGDETGTAEINSIFYDIKYDELFNYIQNDTLKGKTIIIYNAYTKKDKYSSFPFVINVKSDGTIQIVEDENENVKYNSKIIEFDEIIEPSVVTVQGKIHKVFEIKENNWINPKTNTNVKIKSRMFVLINKKGQSITVIANNAAIDAIPPENTEIKLNLVSAVKDNYKIEKNIPIPYLLKVNKKEQIEIIHETASTEYPESISYNFIESPLYNIGLNPIKFNGIIYNFSFEKWDASQNKFIPMNPYYLACNVNKCRKKVKEIDGTYLCEKHKVDPNNIKKIFICNAIVTDFCNEFKILLSGNILEKIFNTTEEELIKMYESTSHEAFFNYLNDSVVLNEYIFTIKGILKVDAYGNKFQIIDIEKLPLNDAIKHEITKIAT